MLNVKVELTKEPYVIGDKYRLHFNSQAVDWFVLSENKVFYNLSKPYCNILNIEQNNYEDCQELIKMYLIEEPLTLQELEDCIEKHNNGWKPDCSAYSQVKYYFELYISSRNVKDIILEFNFESAHKTLPKRLYMKDDDTARLVVDELGEHRIIEFLNEW